jgi:YidC/Oxa1 family membrane protein insertase
MDRTGIIVIALCVGLFGFWLFEQNKYAQAVAHYNATNIVAQTHASLNATNLAASTPATTTAVSSLTEVTRPVFDPSAPEQTLVVSNALARYTFTSHGGGIKLVELINYPDTISARWKTKNNSGSNGLVSLNTAAPTPVMAVRGDATLTGDGNFTLTATAGGVRAEKTLTAGLRLVKDFQVSSNYLVNVTMRWENTSGQALTVPEQEYVVGTATPIDADDSGLYEGMMWFNGASPKDNTLATFNGGGFLWFRSAPQSEFRAGGTNVVWAAAHNQFFAVLAMPKDVAQSVVARKVILPRFFTDGQATNSALPSGIETALVYPPKTLAANTAVEQQIALYAGPKEYRTLAIIGEQFQNQADDVMGFSGFYGFCAKPLLLAMNWLHDITHLGYGLVIILITVLIKMIFWPLTAASTRSMKRMQALQPEMAALKEKYKDDLQKFSSKQWELYKKHKVNPMSGCLPMLIQMPVFVGFITMLRSAIELRGAHFLWAADLSKPDTLFIIPGLSLPIIGTPEGLPFNLLPLLMVSAMVWQAHLTPPSPGMDASQQKIMRFLPLIFLLFFYSSAAGLSLYWMVSTLLGILQTKMTKNLKDPVAVKKLPATATRK